ncbi:site-specific integrase [Neomoorella thermoacetica]|uniref:site-specific integrase n=1 Tax=Neomoorella thermoacetica TaxID=1525 RepID=UPI0009083CA4|nr:tyrosine-type recombinase/integrase [Moorella thermoacetica]APC07618.1 tyrosine recombinase XerC [Moorella thermoacetica]OIQ53749.1 tyrosine recombinase XerC [Moorella thermoacetica]
MFIVRKVVRLRKDLPKTWQEAVEDYLYWKRAQGLRESTIKSIEEVLGLFFKQHPEAWIDGLRKSLFNFLAEPIKPATYNIRLSYLRGFIDWLIQQGILTENPLTGFRKKKADGRIVNLDAETLQKLLALPDRKTFAGLRDYALILLTLDTGIRPKEAFSIMPLDINLRSLEIYVRPETAKTSIARTLPISPTTAEVIKSLLAVRPQAWKEDTPVFCTENGTSLNRHTWNDRLEVYSKSLGIKITPYSLRHAFATWFLRNGGDCLILQRIMGHSDVSMTKRYVHLLQGDVRQQHIAVSPVNTFLKKQRAKRRVEN